MLVAGEVKVSCGGNHNNGETVRHTVADKPLMTVGLCLLLKSRSWFKSSPLLAKI